MNKKEAIEAIKKLSTGIDECETDSNTGWWETDVGAEFGKKYLESLLKIINSIE